MQELARGVGVWYRLYSSTSQCYACTCFSDRRYVARRDVNLNSTTEQLSQERDIGKFFLLTPAFVTYSTGVGEGLLRFITRSDLCFLVNYNYN